MMPPQANLKEKTTDATNAINDLSTGDDHARDDPY
jgi:hypothetical protein